MSPTRSIEAKKEKKRFLCKSATTRKSRICTPYYTPVAEITRFIEEKQNWISKTLQKRSQELLLNKEKDYITGEIFYYLGQSYPLEAHFEPMENTGVVFWNNQFFLNCPANRDMRKYYFIRWYKRKAKEYVRARVEHFSRALNLQPRGTRITSANAAMGLLFGRQFPGFQFPPDDGAAGCDRLRHHP